MARVVPVSLGHNPRALWFDPGDLDISDGTAVVVETARGVEFGYAAGCIFEADEEQIKALKSPLKPVKRLATDEDVQTAAEMEERSREALPYFKELAAESSEDMHPVAVEFLLDGDKAVFYFEAEDRVDFRDLVRKLAAHFHVRIDMRQIGVRDEARLVGGLGHCGQVLCCKRMGGEFCPVSIRMAKEQDLSLNPQKISGVCGRLMCCLRYEYEAYKDFKQRAPKVGAQVRTPEGESKVVELDVLREAVKLSREEEKPVLVPITAFETPKEGKRPNTVTVDGWEEALAAQDHAHHGDAFAFVTSQFTGTDKLAEAGAVRRTLGHQHQEAAKKHEEQSEPKRRNSRRRRSTQVNTSREEQPARKPRRRRSTTISAEGQKRSVTPADKTDARQGGASGRNQGKPARKENGKSGQGPRPGQRSSGLRNGSQGGKGQRTGQGSKGQRTGQNKGQQAQAKGSGSSGQGQRRRRRRSRRGGSGQGQGSGSHTSQGRDAS